MEQPEIEQAIDIALEGAPRAEQLSAMIQTLRQRRAGLARDLQTESDAARRREIQKRMAELDKQIGTLAEQQAISHFVEMSVRVSAMRPVQTEAGESIEEDED